MCALSEKKILLLPVCKNNNEKEKEDMDYLCLI